MGIKKLFESDLIRTITMNGYLVKLSIHPNFNERDDTVCVASLLSNTGWVELHTLSYVVGYLHLDKAFQEMEIVLEKMFETSLFKPTSANLIGKTVRLLTKGLTQDIKVIINDINDSLVTYTIVSSYRGAFLNSGDTITESVHHVKIIQKVTK